MIQKQIITRLSPLSAAHIDTQYPHDRAPVLRGLFAAASSSFLFYFPSSFALFHYFPFFHELIPTLSYLESFFFLQAERCSSPAPSEPLG